MSGDGCASLAARCGISAADFTWFNPSPTLCSTLTPGQKVCCSTGGLPVPVKKSDGSCANYTVVSGDSCNSIALSNSITVANLTTWNANTTGSPPMPPAVVNALCGPQVPGTANPGANGNLSALNPCPLNACCDIWGQCGTTSDFCTPSKSATGAPGTAAPGKWMYLELRNKYHICCISALTIDTTKHSHIHFAFLDLTTTFAVDTSEFQDSFNNFVALTAVKRVMYGTCSSLIQYLHTLFCNHLRSALNSRKCIIPPGLQLPLGLDDKPQSSQWAKSLKPFRRGDW
ncbi:hypothetical protein FB451DRAFT_1395510 [Mycena latifolia]|nr:hypothetical protein FB451DRAFT_1395510 [Mycena latifolia]